MRPPIPIVPLLEQSQVQSKSSIHQSRPLTLTTHHARAPIPNAIPVVAIFVCRACQSRYFNHPSRQPSATIAICSRTIQIIPNAPMSTPHNHHSGSIENEHAIAFNKRTYQLHPTNNQESNLSFIQQTTEIERDRCINVHRTFRSSNKQQESNLSFIQQKGIEPGINKSYLLFAA